MKKLKQQRGITLVALVITIIILLILAAITINLTVGQRGILTRAQEAGRNYTNAAAYEDEILSKLLDGEEEDNEEASEDIFVSLNETTLSFYNNGEIAKANADSEEHYYGNIKGKSLYTAPWKDAKTTIEKVVIVNKIAPKDTSCYFFGLTSLKVIENMRKIDTINVTNMSYMFYDCSNLTSLDLSKFDTTNVTDMTMMFYGCSNLTSLDLSNFNTKNVKYMSDMFDSCSNLTSLDVSKFNTTNVTDMRYMFSSCSNLASLDLSNFNTAKVTDMNGMFASCSNLTSLDVSKFNTTNVTRMSDMFDSCSNLTTIYVGTGWITSQADTSDMFYNCGTDHVTPKSN